VFRWASGASVGSGVAIIRLAERVRDDSKSVRPFDDGSLDDIRENPTL
jgi:hypothetical protein